MAEISICKDELVKKLCYTELVYSRINKKLRTNLSREQISELMSSLINKAEVDDIVKRGKNFYVTNAKKGIVITINSFTNRVITVDRVGEAKGNK